MKMDNLDMEVAEKKMKLDFPVVLSSPMDIPEILEKIIFYIGLERDFRQAAKLEAVSKSVRSAGWIGIKVLNIRRQPHRRIVLNDILIPESQELEVLTTVWKKCINLESMQIQGFANDFRFTPDGPAIYGGAVEFGKIMERLINLNMGFPRNVRSLELRYVPLLSCLVPTFISTCAGSLRKLCLRWQKHTGMESSSVLHYDRLMCYTIKTCSHLEELTILQPVCDMDSFQEMFRQLKKLKMLDLTELRTHDRSMREPLVRILSILENENQHSRFQLKLDKYSLLSGLTDGLVVSNIRKLHLKSTGDMLDTQLFPCFPNLELCHFYDTADSNTDVVGTIIAEFLECYAPSLLGNRKLMVEASSQGYLTSDTPEKTRKILKIVKELSNIPGEIQAEERYRAILNSPDFYTQKRLLRVQGYLSYNFTKGNAFAALKLNGKVGH